jgi:peptidoglycan/LPS O-acetylase OafA/YrhL
MLSARSRFEFAGAFMAVSVRSAVISMWYRTPFSLDRERKLLIRKSDRSLPERNNFDAIRLAMALLVVWSHSFALHLGNENAEWVNRVMGGHFTAGTMAVMVFFVISGFLIAQSFDRSRSKRSYLEKRVCRIYPGYMVATAICAFVVVPMFSTNVDLSVVRDMKVIVHNLLLQNIMPPSDAFATNPYPLRVNNSLWTIPLEFACYLGVLLLGAKRRTALVGLLVLVTLARVGMDMFIDKPWLGLTNWPFLLSLFTPSFLVGMIAYSYRDWLPRSRAILIAAVFVTVVSSHINANLANLIVAPAVGYATFYLAFSDRIRLPDAAKNGDFSYGAYLYAFPIQQMLQATLGERLNLALFIAASLALSLVAGFASWHLVEKHFLVRGRVLRSPLALHATT